MRKSVPSPAYKRNAPPISKSVTTMSLRTLMVTSRLVSIKKTPACGGTRHTLPPPFSSRSHQPQRRLRGTPSLRPMVSPAISFKACDTMYLVLDARVTKITRMNILLIEDDQPTAAYVENGLRQAGHKVDRTGDGREGVVLATTRSYDAAVIDRMLPGLDGLDIVKSLRGGGVRTPILFLSSCAWIDDRVEGLEAGADDYLSKPFVFFELIG